MANPTLNVIKAAEIITVVSQRTEDDKAIYSAKKASITNSAGIPFTLAYFESEEDVCICEEDYSELKKNTGWTCSNFPKLRELITNCTLAAASSKLDLPADQQSMIYVPVSKQAAMHIIQYGYRGDGSIWHGLGTSQDDYCKGVTEGSAALTYYISCLVYFCDLQPETLIGDLPNVEYVTSWTRIFSIRNYSKVTQFAQQTPLDTATVILHAVVGAYAMCRAVASKSNFPLWQQKRYSAIAASLQLPIKDNVRAASQENLQKINQFCVGRPDSRKIVYNLIKHTKAETSAAAVTIQTQVAMLTAHTEMTTYCLINKLIATGGPLLVIDPIPKQLVQFMAEQKSVQQKLKDDKYQERDIQYIHLLYPNFQCFKAADYPDILLAAIEKEKVEQGVEKATIKGYQAKTNNATLLPSMIRHIVKETTASGSAAMDDATKEELIKLGFNPKELIEKANKIFKRMSRLKEDMGYESD